ncbi:TIGR00366 family protein [Bacillus dakarensis]|uniref:TIGR00366 family protein n=1 Tax=Robertmurraya dakarensis TaxID=1926278 RepID=UPI000A0365F0|nr:TIGR00366 family protein [Bacillus dakarensis]
MRTVPALLHYPLIIAAAYSGFTLYGLGLSSSVPLVIATPGHFLEELMGIVPLSETIFSFPMLLATVLLLIILPITNSLLHPKAKDEIIEFDASLLSEAREEIATSIEATDSNIASKLNNNSFIGRALGIIGVIYVMAYFMDGGSFNLFIVNTIILFLGVLLMGSPSRYVETLGEGIKSVTGIVLQYPLYAGIMGILAGTGLASSFAQVFVDFSTDKTLPLWGLISAYFINILAPSAGGQWAIQGPIMIEAANQIGTSINITAMSVMMGDTWNNLVQPFWILPILALSKLKLKDVMSYTVIMMFWVGLVLIAVFLLWAYL